MWERFSYYGMRALLILFMTASVANGGLGFPTSKAGEIYGLYTSMVLLLSLPGGWLADRIIGQRRAVLWGGMIIALGHYSMAIPSLTTFYLGLTLIVIGTGLLKPNISTMVGALYAERDVRRDAGFSIFYMGINIGAFISPLVCGYLGENINWHYGFGAAGVGMTLGLIQYTLSGKYLGNAGLARSGTEADFRLLRRVLTIAVIVVVIAAALIFTGVFSFSAENVSDGFGLILAGIVVAFFVWLLTAKGYTPVERRRFWAILVLFLASALFWSAFEQAGSTLNLFAERNTNMHAWDAPLWGLFRASYFQSFNSIFHHRARAGIRLAMGQARAPRALHHRQILLGPCLCRAGLRHPDSRGQRNQCQPLVAHRDLPAAHDRRAVPEPRRAERDDETRARAHRQPHDGRLVPVDFGGRFHRRPPGVRL